MPLLIYLCGVPPRPAIAISLAAVGGTALAGAVARARSGEVELRTALIFAAGGMAAAPLGSWTGAELPEGLLLTLFGALMILVAVRMWRRSPAEGRLVRAPLADRPAGGEGPGCRRDARGRLRLDSRCAVVLAIAGLATGYLAGLFGVGGGFVIVPALVLFTGMAIHRAVATSLLVIALIAASGVTSQVLGGAELDPGITALFVLGGLIGMGLGTLLGRRLAGPTLQRVFAVAIILVGAFVIVRSHLG